MQGQIKQKEQAMDKREESLKEILKNLQTEQFIDEDFPHVYENIYESSMAMDQIEQVIWMPCEELHHKPYYSKDFSVKEISQMKFVSRAINNALILMKVFAQSRFKELTKQRQLIYEQQHRVYKHVQCFEVFLDKQVKKVWIDSFVPVSQVRNKQVFSETINGCVFPCLVEKLLAKICYGYQNVNKLKVYEIIELFTLYPVERIKIKQWFGFGVIEQQDRILKVGGLMSRMIENKKSMIFFRTRKNSKLQLFGLKPNHAYFIVNALSNKIKELSNKNQGQISSKGISFLQLPLSENNQGVRLQWIGKLSKYRAEGQVGQLNQVQDRQLRVYENFMLIKDMIQVSKQLIVLHNTQGCLISQNVCQMLRYKNLSQSYMSDQEKPLIQNNVNSQIIQLNSLSSSHSANEQKNKIHSANAKKNKDQSANGQKNKIHSANAKKNKDQSANGQKNKSQYVKPQSIELNAYHKIDPQLFLVYHCINIVFKDHQHEAPLNDKSILEELFINLRVSQQTQNQNHSTSQTILGKCTLILVQSQSSTQINKIITTQNTYLKMNTFNQLKSSDLFINLSSIDLKIGTSLSLILLLDAKCTHKSAQDIKIRLKTTLFCKLISQTPQNLNNINFIPQAQAFRYKIHSILKKMLQSSQPNIDHKQNPKDSQIDIICKQFMSQLNLGVIYFRLNNQQESKQKASNHQKIKIEVQINRQIMLEKGIYLLQRVGQVLDCQFDNEKNLLSYSIELSGQNPEFMFVFRMAQGCQQVVQCFNQPQAMVQFPPSSSVKISRIFTANI